MGQPPLRWRCAAPALRRAAPCHLALSGQLPGD